MAEELLPKQVNTYELSEPLDGSAKIPYQLANGSGGATSPAQLASYTDAQKRGAIIEDAVKSASVSSVQGVCDSAADATVKRFDLANYSSADGVLPASMSIKWTNGNTYGDTTASTPEHVEADVYGADGVYIGTVRLSDSLGHDSGKHEAAGDIVDYRLSEDGETVRARAINTDIRQKDANLTIKSDGLKTYKDVWNITGASISSGTIGTRGDQEIRTLAIPSDKVVRVTQAIRYIGASSEYQVEPFFLLQSVNLEVYCNFYRAITGSTTGIATIETTVEYY